MFRSAPFVPALLCLFAAEGLWAPPAFADDAVIRGSVRAAQRVELNAPVDGILGAVEVLEGSDVAADALLAVMRSEVQEASVEQARVAARADADIRDARLAVEEAKALAEHTQEAFDQQAASSWELRRAKLGAARADALLDAAEERRARDRKRLAVEERMLERYQIRAPFAGRVSRVEADPGATLTREDALFTLVSLDQLEAVLFLPVAVLPGLEIGSRYPLRAGPPVNRSVEGTLIFLDPEIDPGSQTVRAVFGIDNREARHPAGYSVELELP